MTNLIVPQRTNASIHTGNDQSISNYQFKQNTATYIVDFIDDSSLCGR